MKLSVRLQVFIYVAFFLCSLQTINAQVTAPEITKSSFWSKVRFGGNVGLNFGNNVTNITVAPSALYQPNRYVAFGPGLIYSYQKFRDARTSLYGGSAIVISNPLDFLQVSAEVEQLFGDQEIRDPAGTFKNDINNTALFLGAGYRLNIGGNSLGAIGIRYNVLFDNDDSIYAEAWQPFVRVYF